MPVRWRQICRTDEVAGVPGQGVERRPENVHGAARPHRLGQQLRDGPLEPGPARSYAVVRRTRRRGGAVRGAAVRAGWGRLPRALFGMMRLDLSVPGYTTLSRRSQHLRRRLRLVPPGEGLLGRQLVDALLEPSLWLGWFSVTSSACRRWDVAMRDPDGCDRSLR